MLALATKVSEVRHVPAFYSFIAVESHPAPIRQFGESERPIVVDDSAMIRVPGTACGEQRCVAGSILGGGMRDPIGFMEPGKKHSQVHLDGPGLCPLCLERDIDGREGGAKTQLVEEMVDGVKTGKWICPDGGRSYVEQGGGGAWRAPIFPPI